MTDYSALFDMSWRGWNDCKYRTRDQNMIYITSSKAKCYNDLLHEMMEVKQKELTAVGGKPFYEPSTFYGSFQEAHYHNNVEWAAGRLASDIFNQYSRYKSHKCHDVRVIPEERGDYDLKLWRISHPEPLTGPQAQLWAVINEVTATEPWAWPMMIALDEVYYKPANIKNLPVVLQIQGKFMGLGYTEKKFLEVQNDLWKMLQWDRAKGM
jgi:hypothetical protein